MTDISTTAYPRLKTPLTRSELAELFTPMPAEMDFIRRKSRGDSPRLTFAVLLKCFQSLDFFPALPDVPEPILIHLRNSLSLPEDTPFTDSTTSLYRYHAAIRDFIGVSVYADDGADLALRTLRRAALTMNYPADLISAVVEELIRHRIELPAYSYLDRLAHRIRHEIHTTWYQMVFERLSQDEHQVLDRLPIIEHQATRTTFTEIKQPPGRAVLSHMRRTVKRLRWLEGLMDTGHLLMGIPAARIKDFAEQARALEGCV